MDVIFEEKKEYKHKPSKMEKFIIYFNIFDEDTMQYLIHHNRAIEFEKERIARKQRIQNWENRYKIPRGLNKKELNKLLKDTQERINYYKGDNEFLNLIQDDWIEKKLKIKNQLKFFDNKDTENNLLKAKNYPIENLIEFRGGFAKRCPNHSPDKDQDTPSLYHKSNTNFCFCFVCNQKFDSLDIYQKLNNVDLSTAIKALNG